MLALDVNIVSEYNHLSKIDVLVWQYGCLGKIYISLIAYVGYEWDLCPVRYKRHSVGVNIFIWYVSVQQTFNWKKNGH